MSRINKLDKWTLIATLSFATTANAADGQLGASSSGSSEVTVTKEDLVLITGVGDLDLGAYTSTAADLSLSDALCVYSSTSAYKLTVTSANASDSFQLEDVIGGSTIPYALTWADSSGNPNTVEPSGTIGNLSGNQTSTSCSDSSGTNASFSVTVLAADFNNAPPGNYSDTLTLMIEPE